MGERKVTVAAEVGLHARPAATFVQRAKLAPMDITVTKSHGGGPVNGKSILAIMALDVRQGESVVISAEGEGADEVLDELAKIASTP
ncbi:HPr family phosphocarrier protein [Nonomuraea monospora]|uniref:Phosphocarrier protein HPr n=2 Tax=Nonomuraea TaxID=83681 RepID=A0A1M4E0X9_9ACTN|nr:HPr family phosphocarrier protein [Nonomuraea gerenzanensis]UBU14745.1 HPr family phosphocarrier protein [Nonomuraea gerenzanensis]SBO92472.1 Phosphocarrier protein of PTS system [Nonomuraea gerenzanensis]